MLFTQTIFEQKHSQRFRSWEKRKERKIKTTQLTNQVIESCCRETKQQSQSQNAHIFQFFSHMKSKIIIFDRRILQKIENYSVTIISKNYLES